MPDVPLAVPITAAPAPRPPAAPGPPSADPGFGIPPSPPPLPGAPVAPWQGQDPPPTVSATAAPAARRRRAPLVLAALVVVVVLVGGGLAFVNASGIMTPKHTIRGLFALFSTNVTGSWDTCRGASDSGYADFSPGTPVTITDSTGKVIGAGALQNLDQSLLATLVSMDAQGVLGIVPSGAPDEASREAAVRNLLSSAEGSSCSMYWTADVVQSDFYTVEIGKRGKVPYSAADMAKSGWVVYTTLGH